MLSLFELNYRHWLFLQVQIVLSIIIVDQSITGFQRHGALGPFVKLPTEFNVRFLTILLIYFFVLVFALDSLSCHLWSLVLLSEVFFNNRDDSLVLMLILTAVYGLLGTAMVVLRFLVLGPMVVSMGVAVTVLVVVAMVVVMVVVVIIVRVVPMTATERLPMTCTGMRVSAALGAIAV